MIPRRAQDTLIACVCAASLLLLCDKLDRADGLRAYYPPPPLHIVAPLHRCAPAGERTRAHTAIVIAHVPANGEPTLIQCKLVPVRAREG